MNAAPPQWQPSRVDARQLADLIDELQGRLAAATQMPLTILLGGPVAAGRQPATRRASRTRST